MRLLPARRDNRAEAELEAGPESSPAAPEPAPESRYRELVRRLADAAGGGHREHVPF